MFKFNTLARILMPFASDTSNVVDVSQFSSVLDSLTSQISVGTILGVITATIGAGIGLVFMWWGVRKLVRAVMSAFKSGKLKF